MLIVPASELVVRLIAERRLCVLTSNRTGPLGEAPTLGIYAKFPFIPILFNWLGYAPVGKMKFAGLEGSPGGMRAIASPVALKPVSAIGLIVAWSVTMSVFVEIIVTCPALALSCPSTIAPPTGSDRNCVTKTRSSV